MERRDSPPARTAMRRLLNSDASASEWIGWGCAESWTTKSPPKRRWRPTTMA